MRVTKLRSIRFSNRFAGSALATVSQADRGTSDMFAPDGTHLYAGRVRSGNQTLRSRFD
jgi:hypothetical protein